MANIVDLAIPPVLKAKQVLEKAKKDLYEAETQALLLIPEEELVNYIKRNFISCVIYMAAVNAKEYFTCEDDGGSIENNIQLNDLEVIVPDYQLLIDYIINQDINLTYDYFTLGISVMYSDGVDLMYSEVETHDNWTYSRGYYIDENYNAFAHKMMSVFRKHYNEILKDYIEESITMDDINNIQDNEDYEEIYDLMDTIQEIYNIRISHS